VVVIGDSRANGFEWLSGQKNFTGKLYSVQVNPETIKHIEALGVENYTSLLDIPEPVDLAIVAVSRTVALKVLEDCIRKDVAVAHFFTAGFSETGTEEGMELERQLVTRAEEANFHIIGPNCMGIYNPRLKLRQSSDQYLGNVGQIGFMAQSGNVAIAFSLEAHMEGLNINKSVSFGNGVVLDCTDFLEYFGNDPEIEIIGMYLEGVKDGRRFFKVLKEVSARKPVVILKGGRTEEGGRAIFSHTGSLAVSQTIWETAVQQGGAVQVSTMDELIDTMKALLYLPPVRGDRVVVAGGSGGQSVATADIFAEVGLRVPPLSQESYDELATFFNVVGGSYRNPIDTAGPTRRDMKRIMDIAERDANIDNIVFIVSTKPGRQISPEQLQGNLALMEHIKKKTSKPVMAIVFLFTPDAAREMRSVILECQKIGIPAFPSIERAAFALRNTLNYYSLKSSIGSR